MSNKYLTELNVLTENLTENKTSNRVLIKFDKNKVRKICNVVNSNFTDSTTIRKVFDSVLDVLETEDKEIRDIKFNEFKTFIDTIYVNYNSIDKKINNEDKKESTIENIINNTTSEKTTEVKSNKVIVHKPIASDEEL